MKITFLLALLLLPAGYAQYPGQYPPGQYPPGTYPPGQQGPGLPIPGRGKRTSKEQKTERIQVIRGVVRQADTKSIEIEAEDERILTFQISEKAKKPDAIVPGDKVEIDATQDDSSMYVASSIKKLGSGPPPSNPAPLPATPNGAAEPSEDTRPTTTMSTPVPLDPEDEGGPPKLKRGIPKPRKPIAATPTETARNTPTPTPTEATPPETTTSTTPETDRSDLIEKAKQAADEFLTGLPNYMVQQFTTRYMSEGRKTDWKAQDVVSADVIYEKGKERYEHIAVNGRATKKSPEETGAWSYGEFGTVLADLFSPATAADFHYRGTRSMLRRPAALYDFEVTHRNSHWTVKVPGQAIMPAYKGTVWISKEDARVLRIEMQAVKIPEEFPQDVTEMALDYDYANIGTEKFLLPAKSEVLSCVRGANICERNVIEFRNYHKYAGESTITFK